MQNTSNKDNIDTVLYHGNCADGFGSAFCVWLYYKQTYGILSANKIRYIPCVHSNDPLSAEFVEKLTGANILMCDFSYKYDQLIRIINVANTFMILDHHKTAQQDLERVPLEMKIFDMSRSGAIITWDFFFPNVSIPKVLGLIQDRDLWTFKMSGTNEFSTYLFEQEFSFELFESFLDLDKLDLAIQTGSKWLEYKKIIISNMSKRAVPIIQKINNKLMIVLYVSSAAEFASDVGNAVFKYFPLGDFSAVFSHDLETESTRFSLRSEDHRADVSAIAKQCGGGGHRNAAGLAIPGIQGFLPFEHAYDKEIISILQNRKNGPLVYCTGKLSDDEIIESLKYNKVNTQMTIEYEYTLFQVNKFNKKWLEQDYMDLIKRKVTDSRYIVFQTPSDKIHYDNVTNIVVPLNDYYMIFNERNLTDPETKLEFNALMSDPTHLFFSSEKEFEDIFVMISQKRTDEYINEDMEIGSDYDNDVDSDSDMSI